MNERSSTLNLAGLSLFSSRKTGQKATLSSWVSGQVMLGHNSAQRICSEVTCYKLSLIRRSCCRESPLEDEQGLPSYVETGSGNSLYSCYSLSNNGTIAHVCLSLNAAPVFSPPQTVCLCMLCRWSVSQLNFSVSC